MVTLRGFRRRVSPGGREVDVELPAGQVRWLGAQEHTGENTGTTGTHSMLRTGRVTVSKVRNRTLSGSSARWPM
jgi:hypothetical protein